MGRNPSGRLAAVALLLASAAAGCTAKEGLYRGVYDGARSVERARAVGRGERPTDWDPTYDEYERFRKGEGKSAPQ